MVEPRKVSILVLMDVALKSSFGGQTSKPPSFFILFRDKNTQTNVPSDITLYYYDRCMRGYGFKAALRGAWLLICYVNANFDSQFYALTNCVVHVYVTKKHYSLMTVRLWSVLS